MEVIEFRTSKHVLEAREPSSIIIIISPPLPHSLQLSEELQIQQLCLGRPFLVKGCSCKEAGGGQASCKEVEGVQEALTWLVDMVKACRLQGQVQVGWIQR